MKWFRVPVLHISQMNSYIVPFLYNYILLIQLNGSNLNSGFLVGWQSLGQSLALSLSLN